MKKLLLILALALSFVATPTQAQVVCVGAGCAEEVGPRFKIDVTIPTATVNNMFSVPVTLVAAESGITLLPDTMVIRKAAGAYTIAGSTGIDIKWTTGGGQLMRAATAGFLDQAGVKVELDLGPGSGAGLYSTLGASNNGNGGALTISLVGANTSGAGGDLRVTLWYRKVNTAP